MNYLCYDFDRTCLTGQNVEHIFTDLVERIIDMIETEAKRNNEKNIHSITIISIVKISYT